MTLLMTMDGAEDTSGLSEENEAPEYDDDGGGVASCGGGGGGS